MSSFCKHPLGSDMGVDSSDAADPGLLFPVGKGPGHPEERWEGMDERRRFEVIHNFVV